MCIAPLVQHDIHPQNIGVMSHDKARRRSSDEQHTVSIHHHTPICTWTKQYRSGHGDFDISQGLGESITLMLFPHPLCCVQGQQGHKILKRTSLIGAVGAPSTPPSVRTNKPRSPSSTSSCEEGECGFHTVGSLSSSHLLPAPLVQVAMDFNAQFALL
jgi:hypothetical protein